MGLMEPMNLGSKESGLDRALAGAKIHAVSSSDKPGTSPVGLAV